MSCRPFPLRAERWQTAPPLQLVTRRPDFIARGDVRAASRRAREQYTSFTHAYTRHVACHLHLELRAHVPHHSGGCLDAQRRHRVDAARVDVQRAREQRHPLAAVEANTRVAVDAQRQRVAQRERHPAFARRERSARVNRLRDARERFAACLKQRVARERRRFAPRVRAPRASALVHDEQRDRGDARRDGEPQHRFEP